jgi:hypothetical protein
LRLLSEEVFSYGKEDMSLTKQKMYETQYKSDFAYVYQLCEMILQNVNVTNPQQNPPPTLILNTLVTLQSFVSWIAEGYIYIFIIMFLYVSVLC